MTPSRNRSIPAAISIISFVSALYLIFRFLPQLSTRPSNSAYLVGAAVFSLNITILFSSLAFGTVMGASLTIVTILIVLWLGLATGMAVYYLFIISFIITVSLGWYFSRIVDNIGQSHLLKLEKLDEELNLLSDEMERKRSYIKSLKEKLSGYSILKEVAEELSTVLSLNDINNLLIEYVLRMVKKEGRVFLFLVDVERQELTLSASKDAKGPLRVKTKKGDPFDHWVFKYRKPLIIEDITKDFRFSTESVEQAKSVFRSLVAAPLVSENRIIGILRMDNARECIFTQDDLRLLDIISDLGAVAIQNAILYARIQKLAIRDGLTGLYLRRYFMERLPEEMRRAARSKTSLSLLMLDIDRFKDYNDTYGHMAGDLVLKYIARKLMPMTKYGDILARYGGDEMVLLLFGADMDNAVKEAEAIRSRIEAEPFILRKKPLKVTVSIGLSNYPQDTMLEDELLKKADERLYKAKSSGRNSICCK